VLEIERHRIKHKEEEEKLLEKANNRTKTQEHKLKT